jgi:Spy/CpxP family protein refolding chaperone
LEKKAWIFLDYTKCILTFSTIPVTSSSKEQVHEKYNQLKNLRQQLADAQFENTLAIREVLNPEQRQKYADCMYKKNSVPRTNSKLNNK